MSSVIRYDYYKDMPIAELLDHYKMIEARYIKPARTKHEQAIALAVRQKLIKQDLFYLMYWALDRKDICRQWLLDRCREVQESPDGHLDLWAREHFKSSIITVGKTIQDILRDPEIRVGMFSFNKKLAADFLGQIKLQFETNYRLLDTFPHILYRRPQIQSPLWSAADGIIVKRKGIYREATVEANGLIEGLPTGKHYTHRIYDDVVNEKCVSNPDQIRKVTAQWELSISLGNDHYNVERYIGTRYHMHDTYAEMINRKAVNVRIHAATSDQSHDFSKAVLMTPDALRKKYIKQGPYTFNCQMLQCPTADKVSGFRSDWLRKWSPSSRSNQNFIIIVDPASRKNSKNDYTSMGVFALGEDGIWRMHDFIRDRLSLTERAAVLFDLHREYRPMYVFYEQYGASSDVEYFFVKMQQDVYDFSNTLVTLPCKELSVDPRTKTTLSQAVSSDRLSKEQRILRLVPHFQVGNIILMDKCLRLNHRDELEDMIRTFVEEEYESYPVVQHDDALDMMSYLTDPVVKALVPRPVSSPNVQDDPNRVALASVRAQNLASRVRVTV